MEEAIKGCAESALKQNITLRDCFAAHAREEDILANIGNTMYRDDPEERAKAKYAYADSMLAAREANNGK